jgi:hypothetical protein
MKLKIYTLMFLMSVTLLTKAIVPTPSVHLALNEDAGATQIVNAGSRTDIVVVPNTNGGGIMTSGVVDPIRGKVWYVNTNYNAFFHFKKDVSGTLSDYPGTTGNAARTYMFWVKPDGLAFSALLNSGIGPAAAFDVQLEGAGNPRVGDGTNYTKMYDITMKNQKWVHLAFVMKDNDGIQDVKMYINGRVSVPYNTGTNAKVNTDPNGVLKFLQKYKGWASDFRYFETALTGSQIREVYGKKDLILHYKFNESAGNSNIADYSGNNFTATMQGIFLMGEPDPVRGKVVKMAGASLEPLNFKGVLGDNPRTICFWYKQDALAHSNISYYGAGTDQFQIQISAVGAVTIYNSFDPSPSYTVGLGPIDFTTWKHVAVVSDGNDANFIQVYVDGTPLQMDNANITKQLLYTKPAADMKVLNDASGYLSDYRIYAGALTPAEIAAVKDGTTAVKQIGLNQRVYPNVTTGIVHFAEPVHQVQVLNISGVVQKTYTNSEIRSIDLSGLNSGMYILLVNNNEYVKILKK